LQEVTNFRLPLISFDLVVKGTTYHLDMLAFYSHTSLSSSHFVPPKTLYLSMVRTIALWLMACHINSL